MHSDKAPELEQFTISSKLEQNRLTQLQNDMASVKATTDFKMAFPDFNKILSNFSRSRIFSKHRYIDEQAK